jgi:hypothetical protein
MALNAASTWYVRKTGVETNGGGFDSTVAGAGTNYADQAAPQLAITDLASTASTTVTSAAGGFTAAMIGNILRLASATGTPVADSAGSRYLRITAVTDTNTATVDKTSGTYTAGIAKVGGAHASIVNYSNGGAGLPTPALTTPLIAGNTVYVRSAGDVSDPSIAGTPDYDYSAGYWTFPVGTVVSPMRFVGLGLSDSVPTDPLTMPTSRPLIKISGLLFYTPSYTSVFNFKTFTSSTPTYTTHGVVSSGTRQGLYNSIHDTNGADGAAFTGGLGSIISRCWIKNTGGGAAGTAGTVNGPGGLTLVTDNLITDVRGVGINIAGGGNDHGMVLARNIIANTGSTGITASSSANYISTLANNTIYNAGGDGILFSSQGVTGFACYGNTVSKIPSGKFAFKVSSGTVADNDRRKVFFDYNNAYLDGGAGGLYSGLSAGPHDVNVDPGFTDPTSATYNFAVGTNLKAVGFGIIPIGSVASNAYVDIGALQRQEAASGGGERSYGF